MIKNKKQMFIVIGVFALILFLGGTTYAWFSYRSATSEQELIAGDIYLHLNEGQEEITLTNVFPETPEEARARNDNYITFSIDGINTSSKTIYYEFILDHGTEKASPKSRYRDGDLRFDLIEINGNNETYLLSNVGYDTLVNKRIYVDTIDASTTVEVERQYKLRMWLSDEVIISDTDSNRTYTAAEYTNKYASIKLVVAGDFKEKEVSTAFYLLKSKATSISSINFGYGSSDSNGKGLYLLYGTGNNEYPIYYYRGEIYNNNVLFAGFCWQIIRTTDTGGVKMIYNGEPEIVVNGGETTYNCGKTRPYQNSVQKTVNLQSSQGYYFADDYEIISSNGNGFTYKLKGGTNGIEQIPISSSNAATVIPTIAANYPYTCLIYSSIDGTCTDLYKVGEYANGTTAYVYKSGGVSTIGYSKYNSVMTSVSDAGYMSNERYPSHNMNITSGTKFGKDIEWHSDHYLVIDETPNMATTNTNRTGAYRYTCGTVTSGEGDTECSTVRYYYFSEYFIYLSGGELVEDAIYKMTGNGSPIVKARHSNYDLNTNNSTIKSAVEDWFRTNLTNEVNSNNLNYQNYIEDTIYCNDRSFKTTGSSNTYVLSGWNPASENQSVYLSFGVRNRLGNNWYSTTNVPDFTCEKDVDKFTKSPDKGNGKLAYPVGLLTTEDIILAGAPGNGGTNVENYLYTGYDYWTMSPSSIDNNVYMTKVYYSGGLRSDLATNSFGVRPVISLKLGVEFESGGDGTPTNPYVVKYN